MNSTLSDVMYLHDIEQNLQTISLAEHSEANMSKLEILYIVDMGIICSKFDITEGPLTWLWYYVSIYAQHISR